VKSEGTDPRFLIFIRVLYMYYPDDPETDEIESLRSRVVRRIIVIVITLLLVFAILATTILPGFAAARRNEELRQLPPPTIMPRL
jgi:hypothetical protein